MDVEEIGVHMLSTNDSGIVYKHRMYTFRIEKLNRTYRMAKLVLPHPILKRAYLIRFIFSCEGPIEKFFYYVPLYRKIIESFTWIRGADVLSDDSFLAAGKRFSQ